jgi:hypothetical protein
VVDRAQLFNELRDNLGVMLIDTSEEFSNVSAQLGSLDALQAQSQEHMASIPGIPLVKLFGISPHGLNASSEGEIRVFYDWIHAFQDVLFRPNLMTIFNIVQLNEFGQIDPDISFDFEPLWSLSEKEVAEVRKTEAETDQLYIDSGVIQPGEARERIAADHDSPYHGLDPDELPDLREELAGGLQPGPGGAQSLLGRLQAVQEPGTGGAADAAPRTLYVSRPVENAAELLVWAREQGFSSTLAPDDLHVTLCYSRVPVAWFEAGMAEDTVIIPRGGPRTIERFGEAVVLRFASWELTWRHDQLRAIGASHDHPEYAPHVTIAYGDGPEDLSLIEPYQGRIVLGPEVFKEVDEMWRPAMVAAE